MSDFHYIIEDGKVVNGYQDADAPEIVFPPNHLGQAWETFDPNDWDMAEMLAYTGQDETHAVYGIPLHDLIESGVFDWNRKELDWKSAAYDEAQYERVCAYFIERFRFRSPSIVPLLEWMYALRRMLVYELMPKYKPLYAQVESGIAPLGEDEYYKERKISSMYPETLLSGNSDYISSGDDREYERIKVGNAADDMVNFAEKYQGVDELLLDEIDVRLFTHMYTTNVNAF